METTKTCIDCNESKPLDQFYKNSLGTLGRANRCHVCMKIYRKALREMRNNYDKNSDEYMVFNYFKAMKVYPNKKMMVNIMDRLNSVDLSRFLQELDKIQKEIGADPSNYNYDLLDDLREDRRLSQRWYSGGGSTGTTKKRRVRQLTLQGEYIQTFDSVAAASRAVCGSVKGVGAVSGAALGKSRVAYGYVWEYDDLITDKYTE